MSTKLLLIATALSLLSVSAALAQQVKLIKIDSDGDFHIDTKTIVADHLLRKGMYRARLQHVNGREEIAFYTIPMGTHAKGMQPGNPAEIFRVPVAAVPGTKVKKTILEVVKNGKVQLAREISFKGEDTRYILPSAQIVELPSTP